eukprot:1117896-Rhodomonas_salina.2
MQSYASDRASVGRETGVWSRRMMPTPSIAVDWRVANTLPFAKRGNVDCQTTAIHSDGGNKAG